jgi:hypothetical protein
VWSRYIDPESAYPYYVHSKTGETSWYPPAPPTGRRGVASAVSLGEEVAAPATTVEIAAVSSASSLSLLAGYSSEESGSA